MGVSFQNVETIADFEGYDLRPEVLRRVPRALALRYDILSLASDGNQLTVALADTGRDDVIDRLRLATGMRVKTVQAPLELIRDRLSALYPAIAQSNGLSRGTSDEAPAIAMLDRIHAGAAIVHASDVHVEPSAAGGRVRQRVDGILHDVFALPPELFAPVVSRIKVLAGMDIADKRQPQDGRYCIEVHGRSLDARVSSMPTIAGEKLVVRLLDQQAQIPSLENLGLPACSLEEYRRLVHAPHGFVVVCGPTGSGKTTTLYATLAERNVNSQNLCSVEDPVEIRISGVSQVQVNQRAGVTFATALRSFLRQDPNLIMVGEMRDTETADVAVSAALSGQLVLTTLHSSDAIRTIDRLSELGVERHLVASSLSGVVAQRLVRKLCVECRERVTGPHQNAGQFGVKAGAILYEARGCARCTGTGYRGRTAIFEFLFINDAVRDAIAIGSSAVRLEGLARDAGYTRMVSDGLGKALLGTTSLDELQRVLAIDLAS